jgi:hypothetical protein
VPGNADAFVRTVAGITLSAVSDANEVADQLSVGAGGLRLAEILEVEGGAVDL